MIYNVVDRRKRPFEATSHDNTCQDTDRRPESEDDVVYSQRENISLHEAILWAQQHPCAVTLYIYDKGAGAT